MRDGRARRVCRKCAATRSLRGYYRRGKGAHAAYQRKLNATPEGRAKKAARRKKAYDKGSQREKRRAYYAVPENRERHRALVRAGHLRREYNMTTEEYDALLASQGGLCPICQRPPKRPHVDHDHRTKAVRGILCGACNQAVGLLGDSPEACARATVYLHRPHVDAVG